MATRAVPVVVERSPGGGGGFRLSVASNAEFRFCSEFSAVSWVRDQLAEMGANQMERGRVLRLILAELRRTKRAEVTAEVSR